MVEKNDAKLGSINRSLVVLQAWLGIVGSSSEKKKKQGHNFWRPQKTAEMKVVAPYRALAPSSAFSSFTGVKEPHLFSLFSQYTISRPKAKEGKQTQCVFCWKNNS